MMCTLAISCRREKADTENVTLLLVDCGNKSKIKLSEFVDSIAIIPLETSDSSIIGRISKIQLFDNRIYLLDMLSNAVFSYNISGKFMQELDRTGQGPEEYLRLTDFTVNENGIYVLDISSHKIIRYGFNLDFIEDIKFNTLGSAFLLDSAGFWLYNEPTLRHDDYQLVRINRQGAILARFFLRNTLPHFSYNHVSSNVFQRNGATLYFSPRYDNMFYEMKKDEWSPEYRLSFSERTWSGKTNIPDEDIESDNYIFRRNFYILDDYIVTDYIIDRMRYFSFYNRLTRQIISGSVDNDLIPDYDRFFPQWSDGNFLIESIDSHYVSEDFPGLRKMDALKNLQPDANPVLILYRLKNE
jgi:hypothetical protein